MTDFAADREAMVARQIEARGILNRPLSQAMREVPREAFVPESLAAFAHDDTPLPIEAGQTISQPYIVALMIDSAAVMSRIAEHVVAIERHEELARVAAARMAQLGYDNVRIVQGDGSAGWPEEAPYDAILAAASGSHVPEALKAQLAIGGVLVMPIGEPHAVQSLVKIARLADETFEQEGLGAVRFVPLIGTHGWSG